MTFPTLVPYGDTLLMTNADETLDEILEFNIVKEQWKETSLDISDSWKKKIKKPAGIGCFCLLAILAVSLIYLLLQIALSHQLLLPHIGLLLRLPSPHPQSTPHPHHPPCPHYHEQAMCWSLRGGERQSD